MAGGNDHNLLQGRCERQHVALDLYALSVYPSMPGDVLFWTSILSVRGLHPDSFAFTETGMAAVTTNPPFSVPATWQ